MTKIELITKDDLLAFKDELFAELKKMGTVGSSDRMERCWLKSAEVRKLLNISPGTLQNLRINGTLRFTKIGNMLYYKHEDILKILEGNFSTNF